MYLFIIYQYFKTGFYSLAFECVTKEGEEWTFADVEREIAYYYALPPGDANEIKKLNVHPWISVKALDVLKIRYPDKYYFIRNNVCNIVFGAIEEDYDCYGTAALDEYAHMVLNDPLDYLDWTEMNWYQNQWLPRYNSTRCLNHFSPKVTPRGIWTEYAADTVSGFYEDAIDWATYSISGIVNGVSFDNLNNMTLYNANPDQELADLLRIWGHAIHILGDMGCPPHVRNDDHASDRFTNTSVYEPKLRKISFNKLDSYGGGSFDANSIPVKKLGSEREYLDKLADWTRTHFFSAGTMFSPDFPIKDAWNSWQWDPVYGRFVTRWKSPINVKTLYVAAHDRGTEEKIKLAAATAKGLTQYRNKEGAEVRSLSGDALYDYGEGHANLFAIDEAVVKDFWRYSRNEIVGYAAGLINRLFDTYIAPTIPPPLSPTNVSASAGTGQITISWDPVDDATSYNIYWSTTPGVTKSNGTQIPGVTSPYVHTGLTADTTYYYVVTAVNLGGESPESEGVYGDACEAPEPTGGEWIKRYGGSSKEAIYSIQQTADGKFIAAGYTYSFGAGSSDAWLLKLNSDGSIAWQKTYGGSSTDSIRSIQQTVDGGYIAAGWTSSFGACYSNAWVLKLNSDGSIAWQKVYCQRDYTRIYSIQQTADGGYIAAGDMDDLFVSSSDAWVLKLNSDGSIAWQKTYGASTYVADEPVYSIQQTADGGYIAVRRFGNKARIFKLNSDGSSAWQKTFGGDNSSATDEINSIQQTADGGYIAAGYTFSFGAGSSDAWILKLNSDGNIVWEKSYGWSRSDHVVSIKETADGGYIAAGDTNSFGENYLDCDSWVLKLHSDGSIAWQKIYGKHDVSDDEYIYSVQQTSGGGYVAAGSRGDFSTDAWILKVDSSGEIPGCSAVTESHAIVSDTSAIIKITTLVPKVSSAISVDTGVTPQDTAAQIAGVCIAP
jgi:uncharacterized delta-60 repeat protein